MTTSSFSQQDARGARKSSAVPSRSKRRFHRHCFRCGWGFTIDAWKESQYCPRCGKEVKSRSRNPRQHRNQKHRDAPHFGRTVPIAPTEGDGSDHSNLSISRLWQWTRNNPFTSAAVLGVGAAGLLLVGPALAAAGAALAALGGSIATGTAIAGFVAVAFGIMNECMKTVQAGGFIALGGTAIGGILMLIGSVIAAAGALLTVVGWIALATCLFILVSKAGHFINYHREDITRLIEAMRGRQPSIDSVSASSDGVILPRDGREITLKEILDAAEATLVATPSAASSVCDRSNPL